VVASLLGTAVAVGLAELYSELVGFETTRRRKAGGTELRELRGDIAAVAFGISFPALFFLLAALGALEDERAFTLAKWSGVGLIGLYGFAGARLSGTSMHLALAQGAGVALIGAALILLKSLVH
jgi:VIT1/CCC1 family predicted Fe2+/Mn2+ transporter